MATIDRPGVQRAIRIPLGVVCAGATLMFLVIAPLTLGLTIPPALVAAGVTAWMFAPPDLPPPRIANRLAGWGSGLLVAEIVVLVIVGMASG